MKIIIKSPESTDFENLAMLFDAYRVHLGQVSDFDLAINFVENRIVNNESKFLVAKLDDKKIIGFLQMFPMFSSLQAERVLNVQDLFVDGSYRKRGIANMLMTTARDYAVQKGVNELNWMTTQSTINALNLGEKIGFIEQEGLRIYSYQIKNYNEHSITKLNKVKK